MNIESKKISDTKIKLQITAEQSEMDGAKKVAIAKLAPQVKLDGFRQGHVPANLAEKHINPATLVDEYLDIIINKLYGAAATRQKLRVVANPKIEVTKFVPYSQLEFSAEVEVVGDFKLPNYKTLKITKQPVKITADDIKEVLASLQTRGAEYQAVKSSAKDGNRVIIDFDGKDSKGEAIKGASGKDYPLLLGGKSFITGFEDNLIGLKSGEDKTFTLTFPADYHLKALQSKKVTFSVKVKEVEEVKKDPIDDKFAKKMGPFASLDELKTDIKKQITQEREHQAQHEFEDKIIKTIVAKTEVSLPESLLENQIESLDKEFQQNLAYRGESISDYLEAKSMTKDQYREKELKPAATERLKAGLVLSEIAVAENIDVTPEEVSIRKQLLKGRYSDPNMQAELDKPEATQELASQLLTEKTIAKLVGFNSK